MKVTITSKKTFRIRVDKQHEDIEGHDLKDCVLAAGRRGLDPVQLVKELAKRGYENAKPPVATKTRATFFLRKGAAS